MDGDVIDADGQVECIDIDECADKTHECSPNAQCENTQVPWSLINFYLHYHLRGVTNAV